MRDCAQVTAPDAIASIVAVGTRPNRQNRSTCSRNNARINDLDGRTTKGLNGVSMAFAIAGTPWLLPTERFAPNSGKYWPLVEAALAVEGG